MVDDIIKCGDRIFIPKFKKFELNQLYLGHSVICRMMDLAPLPLF